MADSTAGDKSSRKASRRKTRNPIDENLKRVYQDMVEDDVPDRFLALLDRLREQGDER